MPRHLSPALLQGRSAARADGDKHKILEYQSLSSDLERGAHMPLGVCACVRRPTLAQGFCLARALQQHMERTRSRRGLADKLLEWRELIS